MRNIYLTMKDSTQTDSLGNFYPDVMSFPVNKFTYLDAPLKVVVTDGDIARFDIFIFKYYATSDFSDLILSLNSVSSVHDLQVGQELTLPTSADIQRFYVLYS